MTRWLLGGSTALAAGWAWLAFWLTGERALAWAVFLTAALTGLVAVCCLAANDDGGST